MRLLLFCFFAISLHASVDYDASCRFGKSPAVDKIGAYELRRDFVKIPNDDFDEHCVAKLNKAGKTVLRVVDWDIYIDSKQIDVNGDGSEDLVLEGYSGGAHCCWTYTVISLYPRPKVIWRLENERGAVFNKDQHGRVTVETMEGNFDFFVASHARTFFPAVYLRMQGRTLYDVSDEHRNDYDKQIAEGYAALKKLRKSPQEVQEEIRQVGEDCKYAVMEIVLSYLYSNRPKQAWAALKEYWPPEDLQRTKQGILLRRRGGQVSVAVRLKP